MNKKLFNILRTLIAVAVSFIIAFIIVSLVSERPFESLGLFLFGPLRSIRYLGNVGELAIPLVFSGLATAILFQSKLFNLGSEGIFYISGLTAAFVAINPNFSSPIVHPALSILTGIGVGIFAGLIPGFIKAKWGGSELVSSLMLNSILAGVGLYILNTTMRDESINEIASRRIAQTALLPRIVPGTRIHLGILVCILCVVAVHWFFRYHKWGYLLKLFGVNRRYIEYTGYSSFTLILLAHGLAGALAGLGGSIEILGMHDRFRWTSLPGLGFDGALAAMLARNNPLAVMGSALFIAYIRTGAEIMSRLGDVPAEMVSIIQAVVILLISAERFLYGVEQRRLLKAAGV